jgi:Protein of unknown function (DUF3175)
MAVRKPKRWVAAVKTDSTHPPEGLFNKSAAEIAKSLASKTVFTKRTLSGLRMLTYFINRGGKRLSAARRATLERAKTLLSNPTSLPHPRSDPGHPQRTSIAQERQKTHASLAIRTSATPEYIALF